MRTVNEINIHCAATRTSWLADKGPAAQVAEIRRWHTQDNGWADIGYHWVVARDGSVHKGRPEARTGAFEPKVNATAIGVCLVGGFGAASNDSFEQHYTLAQDKALRALIEQLQQRYPAIKKVTGHNDYAAKACPGFNVGQWLSGEPPRRFRQSKTAIGATVGAVGAAGQAAVDAAPALAGAVQEVEALRDVMQPLAESVPAMRYLFIALTFAGVGLALWARWQDWNRGRQ